jgi:hypothetical protein
MPRQEKKDRYKGWRMGMKELAERGEGYGDHDKPLGKESGYNRNKNQSNLVA